MENEQKVEELINRVFNSINNNYADEKYSISEVCKMHIVLSEWIYRQEVSPVGLSMQMATKFLQAFISSEKKTLRDFLDDLGFYEEKTPNYEKKDGNILSITNLINPELKSNEIDLEQDEEFDESEYEEEV